MYLGRNETGDNYLFKIIETSSTLSSESRDILVNMHLNRVLRLGEKKFQSVALATPAKACRFPDRTAAI